MCEYDRYCFSFHYNSKNILVKSFWDPTNTIALLYVCKKNYALNHEVLVFDDRLSHIELFSPFFHEDFVAMIVFLGTSSIVLHLAYFKVVPIFEIFCWNSQPLIWADF